MDKNTIIVAVIFVLLMVGVTVVAGTSTLTGPVSNEAGVISRGSSVTTSEKLYDFGVISMADGLVSHIFSVSNPTTQDIKVEKLATSCMCTQAYIVKKDGGKKGPFGMPGMGFVPPANEIIKAGETMEIEVIYDPNAHGPAGVGTIDRFVYLTDEVGGELQLEIKANVTP